MMLITYKKIDYVPKMEAGYVDIDKVVARYKSSAKGMSYKKLLNQVPVKDSVYFISKNFLLNDRGLKQGKLLDMGCGNGLYSKIFEHKNSPFRNLQYYGCEINKTFVDLCKQINPKKSFFVSHAQQIDKKNKEFKVVYCSGTLHYTLNGWKESIKEMVRVLNKYLILMRLPVTKYNNTFFVHQTVKTLFSVENHFFIVINRDELEREFQKNNLEIINMDYSQEEYPIKGVTEKIILVQYLLKKK